MYCSQTENRKENSHMNKEIFTTANMDVIVNSLMKSAANGNMSAKMVDAVNNSINELKPGKPLSKAEKEALVSLWDNLIVAVANDIVPIGKLASEYKAAYSDASMEKFALDMYAEHKELNKKACKAGAGCSHTADDSKYPKIAATLESIADALKVMDINCVAELLVVTVDDIKKAMEDPNTYGKELADKVSDVRFAALCTLVDTINEFTEEGKDKECCCGDHKCTCNDNKDTNTDDDNQDDESILVNALVKILEEEAAKKKEEEKKQEEPKYKVYCFSSDDFGFKDPFIRHQKQISDLIDRLFDF